MASLVAAAVADKPADSVAAGTAAVEQELAAGSAVAESAAETVGYNPGSYSD